MYVHNGDWVDAKQFVEDMNELQARVETEQSKVYPQGAVCSYFFLRSIQTILTSTQLLYSLVKCACEEDEMLSVALSDVVATRRRTKEQLAYTLLRVYFDQQGQREDILNLIGSSASSQRFIQF